MQLQNAMDAEPYRCVIKQSRCEGAQGASASMIPCLCVNQQPSAPGICNTASSTCAAAHGPENRDVLNKLNNKKPMVSEAICGRHGSCFWVLGSCLLSYLHCPLITEAEKKENVRRFSLRAVLLLAPAGVHRPPVP